MTRRIELKVYESDATTLVRTLTQDSGREWLDDLSDVGHGQVNVPVGSTDEAALTFGRIVKCFLDGVARFAWVVEDHQKTVAGPRRNADRTTTVSGRGVLSLLEKGIIYPELAIGLRAPETRFFSFASGDFDHSGWASAVELKQQSSLADPWAGAPAGFPDRDAYWIGVTGDAATGVAPGHRYFRKIHNIGTAGDRRISLAGDDAWDFYVDGDLVGSERRVGLWGETGHIDLYLEAGPHTFAAALENYDRPSGTNVTGFICSCAPLVFGGVPGTSDFRSDDSWLVDDNEDAPPGMSVGDVVGLLVDEFQTRGGIPDVTYDFDAQLDTDGDPWVNTYDLAFPVQTSILEVLRHLTEEHAAEFYMTPTLVLEAWPQRGADLSATVTISYGDNISRLRFTRKGPGPNTTLSKDLYGRWIEATDSVAATGWGRHELGLDLGSAPSETAADRMTFAFFEDHANPVDVISDLQVEEVSGAVPYVDWDVGDTVSAPDSSGAAADYRCVSLAVSEDDAGQPKFKPELVPA